MFAQDFVPPKMPDPAGIPPHVRDVVGPQVYTYGVIAKQPGSNWQYRKQLAEKRRIEEHWVKNSFLSKDLNAGKALKEFELKTNKRNFISRLQMKVHAGLVAAEEDLEQRRNMLREMLLLEESEYTREYVTKAQGARSEKLNEIQSRLEQHRLKKEADERKLVEEKRVQQYRSRCAELREKISEYNRKHLKQVHLKQIEEKMAQKEAEKERDAMYHHLIVKDVEAMKEYEARLERERQERMRDIKEIYDKQLEGKRLLEEEEKCLKQEEEKLIEKLRQDLEQERKEEKEEAAKKREKMRTEMLQLVQQSRDLLDWKKKQEKDMDLAFCKLIQDELDREKARNTDTKRQMRRELELFQSYLDKMKKIRSEEEKQADETRSREMEKVLKKYDEIKMKAAKARENLRQEVIRERDLQVKEKKNRIQQELEKKMLEESIDLQDAEKFKKEIELSKRDAAVKKKLYGKELKDQDERAKVQREKEMAETERQLTAERMAEEQYIKKLEQTLGEFCGQKHPFAKKLEGSAH